VPPPLEADAVTVPTQEKKKSALAPVKRLDASKSATIPTRKSGEIPPEVLADYQTRFVHKLDAMLSGGSRVEVWLSLFGSKSEKLGLEKVSEAGLIIKQGESLLPVPWSNINSEDRAAMAKSIAKDDDVEALVIAAVLNQAAGKKEEADTLLALAALKDAEAAKKTRNSLTVP